MVSMKAARSLVVLVVAVVLVVGPAALAAPDTVGLQDPGTGQWFLRTEAGNTFSFFFGNPGDVPIAGDWDCDAIDTPGLYRQADGFVYLRNSNTQGTADIKFFFGNPGDVPLAGDFNGDGCDTVSIYRPAESRVFIINELGANNGGLGEAEFDYVFGNPGDAPFVGDFEDDGVDTVGLYRQSTGFVYFRNSHTQGVADNQFFFGDPGDRFVAGDWTDDGADTPGVFRPADTTFYLKHTNSEGNADEQFPYGTSGQLPIAGAWGDIPAVPDIALQQVASGLNAPMIAGAPTGDARLFIAERGGSVRILKGGSVLAQPFLTIGGVATNGEGGLLGLAFHPGFAANGRFFVHYTAPGSGGNALESRIVEYHANPGSDLADPVAVRTILTLGQPATNHNAGQIDFGPDGYLYIPFGDGGDDPSVAQDPLDWLGSVLRIDVDGAAPYAIPPGNPFNGSNGAREVYLLGLRNPWRFSIDDNGDVYIGDVGSGSFEEINVATAGVAAINFGWNTMEGSECRVGGCDQTGLTNPVVSYPIGSEGRSVVGGHVYRGAAMPAMQGTYFYSDFFAGWLRSFRLVGGVATDQRDWTGSVGTVNTVSGIGEGGHGELYITSFTGAVYQIVPGA